MDAVEWVSAFAEKIGGEAPEAEEVERLLELAGVAAHASERKAAPIACYVVGRMGTSPADALEAAKEIAQPD